MPVFGDTLTTIVVALGALLLVLLEVLLMRKFNGRERANNLRERGVHLAKHFAMRFAMRFSTPLTSFDVKLQVGETEGLPDTACADDAKPASNASQKGAPVTLPPAQELLSVEGPIDDEPPVRKPNDLAKDSEKFPESPSSADLSPESNTRNPGGQKRKHERRKHERSSRNTDVTNSTTRIKSKRNHHKAGVPNGKRPVSLSGETSAENASSAVVSSPVEAGCSAAGAAQREGAVPESAPLDRGSEGAGPVATAPSSKNSHGAHDPFVEEEGRRGASRAFRASQYVSHPQGHNADKPPNPPLGVVLDRHSTIDTAAGGQHGEKSEAKHNNNKHTDIAKSPTGGAVSGATALTSAGFAAPPSGARAYDAAESVRPSVPDQSSGSRSRDSDDLNAQELRAMFVRRKSSASHCSLRSQRRNSEKPRVRKCLDIGDMLWTKCLQQSSV